MSDRISRTFAKLKKAGRKAFIGYLTAGDPDPVASERLLQSALDNGVDILEIGVPFSDPTADGPAIQAASQRALAAGMNVPGVLKIVRELRKRTDKPLVLFGYANPFMAYGYERFCEDAANAGADAMLVVDIPFEEREEIRRFADPRGLSLIQLIAPTTPPERAAAILPSARGFVYYISVAGVTGARDVLAGGIAERLAGLRKHTMLPIAVGFGISSGRQAAEAAVAADGIVVGSALVNAAREGRIESLVAEISAALSPAADNRPA